MQITNCGKGVHKREIKGIERFKKDLPAHWYGFTNLDVVLGAGKSREVDLIVVADHRIFLVDIKDWYGRIEAQDGRWFQNGIDRGPSPVAKITDIVRDVGILLSDMQKKHPTTRSEPVPNVQGLVVLTNQADRSGIEGIERAKVLSADEFIALVSNAQKQREAFGNVAPQIVERPLTDPFWKERLSRFFGANPATFRPGNRRFQRYLANDVLKFKHPRDVYREYDAAEEGNPNSLGTLRLWDFTKCEDGRFQTEEGRLEIAGREQQVYHWLRDRDEDIERSLLTPKLDDNDRGPHYWEIYDRRRRMQRLSDFATSEAKLLSPPERVELARQLLSAVAGLHRQNAAHLDLGGHSIWIESPTTVRLSHLLAARYPDVKTLGETRFQFLASARLPEDVLGEDGGPKRRDVFLLGVAIHTLLFGQAPAGDPPDWNPAIDGAGSFGELHDWFAEVLDTDPAKRYEDAAASLEAFNKATAVRPTPDEVMVGLERFRGSIRSQMQLAAVYPVNEVLVQSDRLDVWRSTVADSAVVVKMWRQGAWGDLKREGSAVLAFLQKASDIKADRPAGLPIVRDVLWLGDGLVVAQDWIDGLTLDSLLADASNRVSSFDAAAALMIRLLEIVDALHERSITHGDLKPANIVVTSQGEPFLLDALDFSPAVDGERTTGAYAPEYGSRFERDRFALTRIAEDIFAAVDMAPQASARIAAAITQCRTKEPVLSTIALLWEAIESLLEGEQAEEESPQKRVTISINGAQTGPIEQDEGYLFIRLRKVPERNQLLLIIRGVREEIEFRLDRTGRAVSAWRRSVDQRFIARIARHEFCKMALQLVVVPGAFNDVAEAQAILDDPAIQDRVKQALSPTAPETGPTLEEETGAPALADDQASDALAEEVIAAPTAAVAVPVDVPALWRSLIDVENELTTEGVAKTDSYFDRKVNRHKVAFELEQGVFDFARGDHVGVMRQDRRGQWRRIGELDLQLSRPDAAVIDTSETGGSSRLVEAGQRLRFVSHFEVQSLRRRTDAVERILAGNGRSQDCYRSSIPDPVRRLPASTTRLIQTRSPITASTRIRKRRSRNSPKHGPSGYCRGHRGPARRASSRP